jgi:hypothetical protein
MSIQYVGVLKDIEIRLWPCVISYYNFQMWWMKQEDNQRNPTYVKNDAWVVKLQFIIYMV